MKIDVIVSLDDVRDTISLLCYLGDETGEIRLHMCVVWTFDYMQWNIKVVCPD